MTAGKVTTLNLDDLEREGTPEPFTVRHGGKQIEMLDATELDWKALMVAMRDPHTFFKLIVPEEHQETFFDTPMPAWKMRTLMDRYTKHFGLLDPGEAGALPR